MHLLQGPETDPAALEEIRNAISHNAQSCEVTVKYYRKGRRRLLERIADLAGRRRGGANHPLCRRSGRCYRTAKAEESRHELEIAKQIQLSLLPNAPLRLPRVEIAGMCVPATHVGGDYFDYFENSGVIDVVIADVSGHSVGAALIMTEVRSTLRAETRKATSAFQRARRRFCAI